MVKDTTPVEEGVLNLRLSDYRTWLQCPRRFYFEVLQGLYPTPQVSVDADKEIEFEIFEVDEDYVVEARPAKRRDEGTMVHKVVEAYYRGELAEFEFDHAGLVAAVDEIIETAAEALTLDPFEKSWVDAKRYAKAMAAGFTPWLAFEGHDVGLQVVSVEERMHFDLPFKSERYHTVRITGQTDVQQEDTMTNRLVVGDSKTVQTLKKGGPRASDTQLVGYSWLIQNTKERTPESAYQNMIARSLQTAKATPPFYRRVPIAITEAKLDAFDRNLRWQLRRMARTIDQLDRNMRPDLLAYSETQLCSWMCKTSLVCDAMSSGQPGRWQSIANDHYGGTFDEVFDD